MRLLNLEGGLCEMSCRQIFIHNLVSGEETVFDRAADKSPLSFDYLVN